MQDFGREKMCLTIHNKKNLPIGLYLLTLRKEILAERIMKQERAEQILSALEI